MSSRDDVKLIRAIAICLFRQGCNACGTSATCGELHRKVDFADCLARRRRGECERPRENPEKSQEPT